MNVQQKTRTEIENQFKWKIEDLFLTDTLWQKELDDVSSNLSVFDSFRGNLNDMETLLTCLKAKDGICQRAGKVYVYANMRFHEDSENNLYQAAADKAETLFTKLYAAMSFIEPEILAIDENRIQDYLAKNSAFKIYEHYVNNVIREKEHILSPELEELLAQAGDIGNAPDAIYAMINNADMKFGMITDEEGNKTELTHGKFISFMESTDVNVRRQTFQTFYAAYFKQKNTLAAVYNASVKKDIFFSQARKYPTALQSALSHYNIPKEVYTNLIETVHEFLPLMHRYVALRKKCLHLSELHMYDLYTPIVPEINTAISYEEAKETVLRAIEPLGADYVATVKGGFSNGWIDVYENQGKRSGAYSWGAYGCHPFVLLNFDNKINDMFTLAHEIGHAMHSHYSWATQPYVYSDYTIFVAEVASTVNEALLMEHLLKTTDDPAQSQYLINYFLEQFRGTLFRQTMFAEFEMLTHDMVEKGEPLTVESLCKLYRQLNIQYYGDEIVMDDEIDMEWSRIPHFYSAFYVYQYATGYSAAMALSKNILEGGQKGGQDYLAFLKGGSSRYSIDLLKQAGVDMSKPDAIREALTVFGALLDKMEQARKF